MAEPIEDDDYDDGDPGAYADDDVCTHCGGDGYDDCDDPIQCLRTHTSTGLCPCAACGGSGLAKDQTIW